jgi:hypothetical protein
MYRPGGGMIDPPRSLASFDVSVGRLIQHGLKVEGVLAQVVPKTSAPGEIGRIKRRAEVGSDLGGFAQMFREVVRFALIVYGVCAWENR